MGCSSFGKILYFALPRYPRFLKILIDYYQPQLSAPLLSSPQVTLILQIRGHHLILLLSIRLGGVGITGGGALGLLATSSGVSGVGTGGGALLSLLSITRSSALLSLLSLLCVSSLGTSVTGSGTLLSLLGVSSSVSSSLISGTSTREERSVGAGCARIKGRAELSIAVAGCGALLSLLAVALLSCGAVLGLLCVASGGTLLSISCGGALLSVTSGGSLLGLLSVSCGGSLLGLLSVSCGGTLLSLLTCGSVSGLLTSLLAELSVTSSSVAACDGCGVVCVSSSYIASVALGLTSACSTSVALGLTSTSSTSVALSLSSTRGTCIALGLALSFALRFGQFVDH
jgi:hypothetical protein